MPQYTVGKTTMFFLNAARYSEHFAEDRGTVEWSAGGVPARAAGVTYTDWIGPDDPAAKAINGDTWTEPE